MPRRRGEYRLTKSSSFAIFPFANSSDKAFYSAKNANQGTYKAKMRLNVTIAPGNCTCLDNDVCEEEQQSAQQQSYQQQSVQHKEKAKNGHRRELLQLFFSRDSSKDHTISEEEHTCVNNCRRQYRTTSHESSFRNSLKYSFEKIKLRGTSQKYARQESAPSDEMISLMDMMPDVLVTTVEREYLSGKGKWRKSKKVHRSKSGAPKIVQQL
uniref:DUF4817 domain-containing protein n=1 Tax=Elaeophora elaphi TaxID=1147741 RepID=A0A0R3S781_9BILA